MELRRAVEKRRMVRAFESRPVAPATVDAILASALRAPSAGFTQGLDFVVLDRPEAVGRFWDLSLPMGDRADFAWPGLLDAPVLILPVVDPAAYVARYAEPDKAASGLGAGTEAWGVPYWFVDGAFATMVALLRAVDEDLGALFFGLFEREERILEAFGVPPGRRAVGAVALGHPATPDRPSRSTLRPRRGPDEAIRRNRW